MPSFQPLSLRLKLNPTTSATKDNGPAQRHRAASTPFNSSRVSRTQCRSKFLTVYFLAMLKYSLKRETGFRLNTVLNFWTWSPPPSLSHQVTHTHTHTPHMYTYPHHTHTPLTHTYMHMHARARTHTTNTAYTILVHLCAYTSPDITLCGWLGSKHQLTDCAYTCICMLACLLACAWVVLVV